MHITINRKTGKNVLPGADIGIRKMGILVAFSIYHERHDRYPENPLELATVTGSYLLPKQFKKYQDWFRRYTGETA